MQCGVVIFYWVGVAYAKWGGRYCYILETAGSAMNYADKAAKKTLHDAQVWFDEFLYYKASLD